MSHEFYYYQCAELADKPANIYCTRSTNWFVDLPSFKGIEYQNIASMALPRRSMDHKHYTKVVSLPLSPITSIIGTVMGGTTTCEESLLSAEFDGRTVVFVDSNSKNIPE